MSKKISHEYMQHSGTTNAPQGYRRLLGGLQGYRKVLGGLQEYRRGVGWPPGVQIVKLLYKKKNLKVLMRSAE